MSDFIITVPVSLSENPKVAVPSIFVKVRTDRFREFKEINCVPLRMVSMDSLFFLFKFFSFFSLLLFFFQAQLFWQL